jgi:hypothetical protein
LRSETRFEKGGLTMKKSWMCVAMLAVAAALVLGAGRAEADTHGWAISDGSAGDWSDGSKWSPTGPPATTDTVHFNDVGEIESITVNQNVTIANARVKWDELGSSPGSLWTAELTNDGAERTVNVTERLDVMSGFTNSDNDPSIKATLSLTNLHLAIGTKDQRAGLEVARKTYSEVNKGVEGNLIVSGGSVTAYLDELIIARNMGGAGWATGTVDLRDCKGVMIDLAGTAYVGARVDENQASYNIGTFRSGGGSVNVSGNLELADSNDSSGNETGNGSSGKLFLENTTFTVGGQALFYGAHKETVHQRRFAQVDTTVAGRPSGLDLANSAPEALSFPFEHQNNSTDSTYNLIDIKFTADPTATDDDNWYWGMRWEGNHEGDLEGLLRNANDPLLPLVLDTSVLSADVLNIHRDHLVLLGKHNGTDTLVANDFITYDSTTGYTYVGVYAYVPPVSEPASLGLLGLALLGLRKRRS